MKQLLTILLLACACSSLHAQQDTLADVKPCDGCNVWQNADIKPCDGCISIPVPLAITAVGTTKTDVMQDGNTIVVHLSDYETKELADAKKQTEDAEKAYMALQAKIKDAHIPDGWDRLYCASERVTGIVPGTNEVTTECTGAFVMSVYADFRNEGFAIIARDPDSPLTLKSYDDSAN